MLLPDPFIHLDQLGLELFDLFLLLRSVALEVIGEGLHLFVLGCQEKLEFFLLFGDEIGVLDFEPRNNSIILLLNLRLGLRFPVPGHLLQLLLKLVRCQLKLLGEPLDDLFLLGDERRHALGDELLGVGDVLLQNRLFPLVDHLEDHVGSLFRVDFFALLDDLGGESLLIQPLISLLVL